MSRRTRISMPSSLTNANASSRFVPMNEATVLQKATAWADWIRRGNRVSQRDETRVYEAFRLLADKGNMEQYPVVLRQTHALGGKELTIILALAVGKSAFRDMKQELKWKLPDTLWKQNYHQWTEIKKYAHKVECRVLPGGGCSDTASVTTGPKTPSNEPQALPSSNPVSPTVLQPQNQTGDPDRENATDRGLELGGSVYELLPTDILELATGLITQTLNCPGQILLTEPFHPSANPFITIPITNRFCLYLRNQRRRVM